MSNMLLAKASAEQFIARHLCVLSLPKHVFGSSFIRGDVMIKDVPCDPFLCIGCFTEIRILCSLQDIDSLSKLFRFRGIQVNDFTIGMELLAESFDLLMELGFFMLFPPLSPPSP